MLPSNFTFMSNSSYVCVYVYRRAVLQEVVSRRRISSHSLSANDLLGRAASPRLSPGALLKSYSCHLLLLYLNIAC